MKKQASKNSERIKKLLLTDRMNTNDDFIEAMNNDIYTLLSNYIEILDNCLETTITSVGNSGYTVEIKAKALRIKNVGVVK